MRNTISEAVLNTHALITLLQAHAEADPKSCQTDEWKALLAAVDQLACCTGLLAKACQTEMEVPLPTDDVLLDKGVLPDHYAKELREAIEARP
jgi:hypothetical protein